MSIWWFSIFWINSRTLAFCACFTIECGSPGILKSMSATILSRIVSLSVLSVSASRYTSRSSCTATVCLTGRPVLSWVCWTLRLLLSSNERVWTLITSCVIPSLRSSLIECQSFPNRKIDVDPKTASWCFFHALCRYCARRGTEKSICSGSLWLLSLGSISRKNTVCLLLEFWPPGINSLLMIKWRLNAHALW